MSLGSPFNPDVPVADSVDNDFINDVVGNKVDTVAGDSIISLVKQILATIPINEATTTTKNTVIGLDLTAVAGGTSGGDGADLLTITVPASEQRRLHSLLVSMRNVTSGARIRIRVYTEVDGVEEEVFNQRFREGKDPTGIWVVTGTVGISSDLRVEIESNKVADIAVDVPYEYIVEELK